VPCSKDLLRAITLVLISAGDVLDVVRATIPEVKFSWLLKNPHHSGTFRETLGFRNETLGPALERHLIENFGSASACGAMFGGGTRFSVTGPLTGPSGTTYLNITTLWGVDPDGMIRLITATP
jgi:hypothetical protein